MNFDRVKLFSKVALTGVTLDFETRDGTLQSVTITDAKGAVLKIAKDDYSIAALVPAVPKMRKRWAVRGEVNGLKCDERFDDQWSADQRANGLKDLGEGFTVSEVEEPEPT